MHFDQPDISPYGSTLSTLSEGGHCDVPTGRAHTVYSLTQRLHKLI